MSFPYEIYLIAPAGFAPKVQVAGCCCLFKDRVLYLQRAAHVSQPNTWGVPAGKLETDENPQSAIIREVFEETGIELQKKHLEEVGKLYVRHSGIDFIWHQFFSEFSNMPTVVLNTEHQAFKWLNFTEAAQLPLIAGGIEALQLCMRYLDGKK